MRLTRVLAALVLLVATAVDGGVLYSRERHFAKLQTQQLNVSVERHVDAFVNKRDANTTQSYAVISQVPLQLFEFKYDAIVGRTQFGVLGPELRELLPDGVQIVPQRFVVDHDTKQKVALKDFHVVDKDTLFMHNVGATKVLIRDSQQQQEAVAVLQKQVASQQQKIEELEGYLAQEASVQLVEKRRIAESEARRAELAITEAQVQAEEQRQTSHVLKANELEVEQAKHELAQRRLEEEDTIRKQQNRDLVQLQEESNVRLEMKRRETEEVLKERQLEADRERMQLERNTSIEKAHIDVEGRIKQQRLNQDIEMAQLQQRLEADRVKLMQALQATFDNLGQGAMVLLTDKEKLTKFVGGFIVLAAGIYLSREGVRIAGKMIEQRLGKPSLVRETSRAGGLLGFFKSRFFTKATGQQELKDVVLQETLETRVHEIAKSVRNAIVHGAPYRHLLLYGPPGTGKTMVAKRLARSSGMDYAILSGGDVGPLGSDAVTELHALFHWARASPRGVLIFIDEAEAFLGCRATRKTHMSEAMRNALNALLYHTGTQSKHFMLVIATNRPEDLDSAVTDRIDDTLHFDLPEANERVRLLEMYFEEFVGKMESVESKDVLLKSLQKYGQPTEGMSGREIAKMMLYLQSIVYAQDDVKVSKKLVERVVSEKIDEHKRKLELRNYSER